MKLNDPDPLSNCIEISLTPAQWDALMREIDRRSEEAAHRAIDDYEATEYRSFLSLFDSELVPGILDQLSLKEEDNEARGYLQNYLTRFGVDRFEQFIDRLYEETDQGTHMTLSDLGADGGPLFTEMFHLKQPNRSEMSYVDSVSRRDAMRKVGKAAMGLLAADAVFGAGSVALYAKSDKNSKKQQEQITRYDMYGVVPVAVVCSGVIAVHYNYENNIDHINSRLEQIERKLQSIEAGINQLVKVSRSHHKYARTNEVEVLSR